MAGILQHIRRDRYNSGYRLYLSAEGNDSYRVLIPKNKDSYFSHLRLQAMVIRENQTISPLSAFGLFAIAAGFLSYPIIYLHYLKIDAYAMSSGSCDRASAVSYGGRFIDKLAS